MKHSPLVRRFDLLPAEDGDDIPVRRTSADRTLLSRSRGRQQQEAAQQQEAFFL